MSIAEAHARLCAPGALFEMDTVNVRGLPLRSWKNQSPTLPALTLRARELYADRDFIVYQDERVTYEGWFRATAALARHLQRAGVRKGDRVAIAMRNLPEWIPAFFAAAAAGAIVVPLNAWWKGGELAYGLSNSGSVVLICDHERWQTIKPHMAETPELREVWVSRAEGQTLEAPAKALESLVGTPSGYGGLPDIGLPDVAIEPEDDATIFYTSGTTGLPKGALGTHRNIMTCSMAAGFSRYRTILRRGEEPPAPVPRAALLVIPLFHATGCHSTLMSTVVGGGKIVMMHKWDTLEAMRLIERERIYSTGGVPTIAWQLLEHPERDRFDLSSLEVVAYGGAPSAPELVRRIGGDLKVAPGNGWGMTETSGTVTVHGAEDYLHRPDSCGPPIAVSDIKIMSEDGSAELPTGELGELWAYGPQIVKGYWNNPAATAETFVQGWVRTGDLARIDDEGFCYIVDRAKDMIIRGGENIYSIEVENVLYEHPAVIDAALIGLPHRTLGEVPAAVVQLVEGTFASEAELRDWVAARLAAFKVPERIVIHAESLPRNANGKILKRELAALFGPGVA
jgi:acyl-CoA synthetase (AMP-forming)/AMP-acid ligase II